MSVHLMQKRSRRSTAELSILLLGLERLGFQLRGRAGCEGPISQHILTHTFRVGSRRRHVGKNRDMNQVSVFAKDSESTRMDAKFPCRFKFHRPDHLPDADRTSVPNNSACRYRHLVSVAFRAGPRLRPARLRAYAQLRVPPRVPKLAPKADSPSDCFAQVDLPLGRMTGVMAHAQPPECRRENRFLCAPLRPRYSRRVPDPRNIVYFDLETQKSADDVGGWNQISQMRMSVGVTFSTARGGYVIYGEKQVNDLIAELQRADLVVGFNVLRFDYEVLHGYTPMDLRQIPTLDMLVELQKVLPHRLSLDSIAAASLGVEKTSDGLQALRWFREGKLLEIAEYCCYDVKITGLVHRYGVAHKQVYYRNRIGHKLSVPVSW
jgi:hypothetical protein